MKEACWVDEMAELKATMSVLRQVVLMVAKMVHWMAWIWVELSGALSVETRVASKDYC